MTESLTTPPRYNPGDAVNFRYEGNLYQNCIDHDQQMATVVRVLEDVTEVDVAEVGWMYHIRFDDGQELDAFQDELH